MTDPASGNEITFSVGRLAALAGITVRTLHHYDTIGLLSPGNRSGSGHRAYTERDAARLQRILFYRELELPLDRIQALLDDPDVDERDHLRHQHALLGARIDRLQRVRDAIAATMEAHEMSIDLTAEERLEIFGAGNDPAQHAEETRASWGATDAYRESRSRTAQHSKQDWVRITAAAEAIEADLVAALHAGEPAGGPVAMDLAERLRLHMSQSFYAMSHAMQRAVSEMYVEDPRFRAHYDDRAAGLARFVRDAIVANAERNGT